MTLFLQVNKKSTNNVATMNAFALMVFVLLFITSTLVHADHLIEQATDVEASECYICHQGIDTPSELPPIQIHTTADYSLNLNITISAVFKDNHFVQPQLRAPPIFQ